MARNAAALAREFLARRESMVVRAKAPRDYVTEADVAVEKLIREEIARAFPEDAVLGEEGGGTMASRLWVIDPIDGTNNFAHGLPQFAVSIAFCIDGQPVLGVIAEPANGTLYRAQRGAGAFRDGEKIRVSGTTALDQSMVEYGYADLRSTADNLGLIGRLVDAGCQIRQMGSAAMGLARVADGRTDGYCELYLNSWDVLAGMLLITEAGGRFNDFLSDDGIMQGNAVLGATSGIMAALARVTGIQR
jgi:myo-inositol-1(or 4)-monophosphatase